jgi:hypothetical protein
MRAPRPGVKARASHPKYWSEAIEGGASVRADAERVKVTICSYAEEPRDLCACNTSYDSRAGLGAGRVNPVDSARHERATECAGGAL